MLLNAFDSTIAITPQNLTEDAPNQKWVLDITYICTDEGWLYLAVLLELYSRRVMAGRSPNGNGNAGV